MITRDQIVQALLDPTERGTRAVGRALVLLYIESKGGEHSNPMGKSAAAYYLNNQTLTEKQLAFWRRPLRSGEPHICLHADELLELANNKQARRKQLIDDHDELIQPILDKRDELLDLARFLSEDDDPTIFRQAVRELRIWEKRHQIAISRLPNVSDDIEQNIMQEIMATWNY